MSSGLSTFCNTNALRSVEGLHFNFRSEGRLRDVDRKRAVEIVFPSFKDRVIGHLDDNVQVAGLGTRRSRVALACESQAGAVIHTSGDGDFQLLFSAAVPFTAALVA